MAHSGFAGIVEGRFWLDGRPFRVAGANNYYLGFGSDAMVQSVFDLAVGMGLNTLRTWAFLDCGAAAAGGVPSNAWNGVFFQYVDVATGRISINDGPDGLVRLDRTIALAEQSGVRLILSLVNFWDDFGGVAQYLNWFGPTDKDDFYRHPMVKDAYRRYVEHLILRVNTRTGRQYRDEPAILAWELANEPRCVAADSAETLVGWADEMSSFIRSLDSNHPIGVGDEGFFRRPFAFGKNLYNGSFGVDCERLLSLRAVDYGTFHLYPSYASEKDPIDFGTRWIREHIEAGQRAGKPMLMGEYGVKIDAGAAVRNSVFEAWLREIEERDGAGALVWMIAGAADNGQPYPDYDHFTVYAAEDVPAICAFARGEAARGAAF